MSERMMESKDILSGTSYFVCKISERGGVIPKTRAFSSGARDIPVICCCRLVFITPVFGQVLPARIHRFDEFYLLAQPPGFDFLFAGNGGIGIEETFAVDEASQVVTPGESEYEFVLVLPDAMQKISGYPYVQNSRAWVIGHDVDVELLGRAHHLS